MFWKFWSPLAGPGPQPIDPFYWLKVLLKTRSTSASIEPVADRNCLLPLKYHYKIQTESNLETTEAKAEETPNYPNVKQKVNHA